MDFGIWDFASLSQKANTIILTLTKEVFYVWITYTDSALIQRKNRA